MTKPRCIIFTLFAIPALGALLAFCLWWVSLLWLGDALLSLEDRYSQWRLRRVMASGPNRRIES